MGPEEPTTSFILRGFLYVIDIRNTVWKWDHVAKYWTQSGFVN